jgi:Tfp pilus assembly protein PilF
MSHYNLGVILGKVELNELALDAYKKCLHLNSAYSNALNNIADMLRKYGKFTEAA